MSRSAPIKTIIGIGNIHEWEESTGEEKPQVSVEILECGHWFDKRVLTLTYGEILIGRNGRRCEQCEELTNLKMKLSFLKAENV